jgi:hypothetical protein
MLKKLEMRDFLLFRSLEIFKKRDQSMKLKKLKVKLIKKTKSIKKTKKID